MSVLRWFEWAQSLWRQVRRADIVNTRGRPSGKEGAGRINSKTNGDVCIRVYIDCVTIRNVLACIRVRGGGSLARGFFSLLLFFNHIHFAFRRMIIIIIRIAYRIHIWCVQNPISCVYCVYIYERDKQPPPSAAGAAIIARDRHGRRSSFAN